jgi:hypothetical protein
MSLLFLDITQRILVFVYRHFGTDSIKEPQYRLPTDAVCKIPEERRPHLNRGGSLKFLKICGNLLEKPSSICKD